MKSKIIPNTSESEQIVYPVLMQHLTHKYVVLFYSKQAGTVVHEGTNDHCGRPVYELGWHTQCWLPATDETAWKPFKGKIELSN